MKIEYVKGDLFKQNLANALIPHIVNDQNVFGSGFAGAVRKNMPRVAMRYDNWGQNKHCFDLISEIGVMKMGETQFVHSDGTNNEFKLGMPVVANMVAQDFRSGRRVRYDELVICMRACRDFVKSHSNVCQTISAPLFGSKLARGNFEFIEELIYDIWIDSNIPVTIYYLLNEDLPLSQRRQQISS